MNKWVIELESGSIEFDTEQKAIDYKTENNLTVPITTFYDEDVYRKIKAFELDLISLDFINLPLYKLDFTLHLKPYIFLEKITEFDVNGRPAWIDYYFGNEKIVRIIYEFELYQDSYIKNRKVSNQWYYLNDELSEAYIWHERFFDKNILYHKLQMIREKREAENNLTDLALAESII